MTNKSNTPLPTGEGQGERLHWVACWGNATSITDRKESVYSKDITLRYPIRMCFSGSKLRFRFSNLTGTEPVTITKACFAHTMHNAQRTMHSAKSYAADAKQSYVSDYEPDYVPVAITFGGCRQVTIEPGKEIESDEIPADIRAGETIEVSMYFAGYTQMNAGTLITGPLSKGKYSYGDFAEQEVLPMDLTRNTNWFYFLNTIDILTDSKNHAIVCYGDSITAQSWPDYLTLRTIRNHNDNIAIIRRAVSGTRILRQYDCITYQAYGLKGATRFPIEMNTAGATAVIIQHGINDIIHPVGIDVNPFRPWSDMPTLDDLKAGTQHIYIDYLRANHPDMKIYSGTLLPILGWRTYNEERDKLRNDYNDWLRRSALPADGTTALFDGCVDFDLATRDANDPRAFAPGYDSGDHLHPSELAYEAMANAIPEDWLK